MELEGGKCELGKKHVQKQAEELLVKCHVRESMSLCDVLVLLVPKKDDT